MKRLLAIALVLFAASARAQKPWELRVDLPVNVPVELPTVPPANPFASPGSGVPAPLGTPMLVKVETAFHVEAATYVDTTGASRRAVLLVAPLPGLDADVAEAVLQTTFLPARSRGQAVPVWITVSFDLAGRIKEGRVIRVVPTPPDPAAPPSAQMPTTPTADARDLALAATPGDQVDAPPTAKRFRASVSGRTVRQFFRILAEVDLAGRCSRVVFLSCPPGLHQWLLRSLAAWTFRPATGGGGAATAWVQLDGELEAELSGLSADRLRVSPTSVYPRAAAAPADARPRGE